MSVFTSLDRLPAVAKLIIKMIAEVIAVPFLFFAAVAILSQFREHGFNSYCDPIQVGQPAKGFLVRAANAGFDRYSWSRDEKLVGMGNFSKMSLEEVEKNESQALAAGVGGMTAMKVPFIFYWGHCSIEFKEGVITAKRVSRTG